MQIWIDADACPAVIKDIVFRAAERLEISTTLVANRMLRTPPSRFIRAIQVPAASTWPTATSSIRSSPATW
jgi:uncharacterized protein YaiI (UPF0178 family)